MQFARQLGEQVHQPPLGELSPQPLSTSEELSLSFLTHQGLLQVQLL